MRLDLFLTEQGFFDSRTRAQRAIAEGCVKVNGAVAKKPSLEVSPHDTIEAAEDPIPFVSRGALKLKHALSSYNIDLGGKTALDIGASTGGFTEIMLLSGATLVYAVDVGHGQLHKSLRENPRVISLEGTDIRDMLSLEDGRFGEFFDFAACDASFISLTKILPSASKLMKKGALGVFLIKPQFEVGKKFIGKGGIVKNEAAVRECLESIKLCAASCGLSAEAPLIKSPITGGDGNTEYLLLVKKQF